MKKCPFCAEQISDEAVKCKYCGELVSKHEEDEHTVYECHPSWWQYTPTLILGILLIVVVIGIFVIIYIWLERKGTLYRITNKRIISQKGVFSKAREDISIKDIRAINVNQSFRQRIVNTGNISIVTAAGGQGYEIMRNVKDPDTVRETIAKLKLSKE